MVDNMDTRNHIHIHIRALLGNQGPNLQATHQQMGPQIQIRMGVQTQMGAQTQTAFRTHHRTRVQNPPPNPCPNPPNGRPIILASVSPMGTLDPYPWIMIKMIRIVWFTRRPFLNFCTAFF